MGSQGLLQGLTERLGRLFDRNHRPSRRTLKRSRSSNEETEIETAEGGYRFEQKVRKLLARSAGKKGGTLHYIGLAKVQGFFGPRWPAMTEKVHGVAHEAVKRRLADDDLYVQHGDDGYIIVFLGLAKEVAKLKCGLMAQEISKRLFGSDNCEYLEIATVDVDRAGRISAEAVKIGQVSEKIAGHQKASGAWTEVDAPSRASATARPQFGARNPRVSSRIERSPASASGAASASSASRRPSGPQRSPERGTPAIAAKAAASLAGGRLRFVYRPLWFVKRKVIMGYVCVPCRMTADNVVVFGGAAMPLSLASPENAALDRLTVRQVVTDLTELISLNRKSVLVAPIHHLTVANPSGRRILVDLFSEISDELRSLVVFELIGVPEEIGAKDLAWTMEALKPHGKAVLVRRRLENLSIPVLREAGAHGTGAEIGNYSAPEREIIPAMARFVEAADRSGLATYIHGLRTVSLVSAAMGAGFDYIDGDPIAEIDDAPNCIFPFNLRNLYQNVLARSGRNPR